MHKCWRGRGCFLSAPPRVQGGRETEEGEVQPRSGGAPIKGAAGSAQSASRGYAVGQSKQESGGAGVGRPAAYSRSVLAPPGAVGAVLLPRLEPLVGAHRPAAARAAAARDGRRRMAWRPAAACSAVRARQLPVSSTQRAPFLRPQLPPQVNTCSQQPSTRRWQPTSSPPPAAATPLPLTARPS